MRRDQAHCALEEEASEALLRAAQGRWTADDQAQLEARLLSDPKYAQAHARVEQIWHALEAHAGSPELRRRREQALAYACDVHASRQRSFNPFVNRRCLPAAAACVLLFIGALAWQLSPVGYRPGTYRTGIGELRTVQLEDHSRILMDATTRLRVRYSSDARVVELQEGQAQFAVARDVKRPFKVQVGDRSIVALGTVFTVEFVDRRVRVAMMEGRVAVVDSPAGAVAPSGLQRLPVDGVQLSSGEELRISQAGRAVLTPHADLEAAMAWRERKVIFRSESLQEAVRKLNRYSQTRIEIVDQALANERVSGVFEAGNAQRFVAALRQSLPIAVESADEDRIRIRMR